MRHFGQVLDALRQARGMQKGELAKRAGISASYIGLLIRGDKQPSPKVVKALAEALGGNGEEYNQLWGAANYTPEAMTDSMSVAREVVQRESGIINVHKGMPINILLQRIANAEHCVRILEIWSSSLLLLKDALITAAKKDVTIEIALLNPDSVFAEQRAKDLKTGNTLTGADFVSQNIKGNIQLINEWNDELGDERPIKLTIYTRLPSFQIYITDNHALVGFIGHGNLSIHAPQLDVRGENTVLGYFVREEFAKIWYKPSEPEDAQ